KPGATLTQHVTTSNAAPQSLRIEVGELVVEPGGVIDVSGRGYPGAVTHPSRALEGPYSGGSHLGEGGVDQLPVGETYGSLYYPQELGAGGYWEGSGGGTVTTTASRAQNGCGVRGRG